MYEVSGQTRLQQMLDCYNQRGPWQDGTILLKHDRESETGYARRQANICSPAIYRYLVDTFDVIFAHTPSRTGMDATYEAFTEDAGQGQNLTQMLRRAVKSAEVTGSSWLVMDTLATQPPDMESMITGRTYPYLFVVEAPQVVELAVDHLGNLLEFTYKYVEEREGVLMTLYRSYSAEGVYEKEADDDETGWAFVTEIAKGPLPVIPIVPSGEALASCVLPASPTMGQYQNQLAIVNTYSLMDESLYAQQFSVLVVTGRDDLEGAKLGTGNGLKLSEGSTAAFIAPSGTPVDLMLKRVESAVAMMIKTFANLITSADAQSGLAKVIDRQTGAMMLRGVASTLEEVEYKVYETFCRMMSTTPADDYTVSYYKDFDMVEVGTYVRDAMDMLGIDLSMEVKRAIKLDLVKKFFSGSDAEDITDLLVAEGKNTEPPRQETVDTIRDDMMKPTEDSPEDDTEDSQELNAK